MVWLVIYRLVENSVSIVINEDFIVIFVGDIIGSRFRVGFYEVLRGGVFWDFGVFLVFRGVCVGVAVVCIKR